MRSTIPTSIYHRYYTATEDTIKINYLEKVSIVAYRASAKAKNFLRWFHTTKTLIPPQHMPIERKW